MLKKPHFTERFELVNLRVSARERAELEKRARAARLSISDWMRERLDLDETRALDGERRSSAA